MSHYSNNYSLHSRVQSTPKPTATDATEDDNRDHNDQAIQQPHRPGDSPRFARPDSDCLRKRAISGAMRGVVAPPSPDWPPSGPVPDEAPTSSQHGPYLAPCFTRRASSSGISEKSPPDFSLQMFDVYSRDIEHGNDDFTSANGPSSPVCSSPKQATNSHHDWLLPHPFKHEVELPYVGETHYEEAQDTAMGVETSMATESSTAGSRDPPGEQARDRVMRSHFSPRARALYQNADRDISTSSTLESSSSPRTSDRFAKESPHAHWRHRSRYSHYPAYSPSEDLPTSYAPLESEHDGLGDQSIISGPVTQTLTPSTSPYRRVETLAVPDCPGDAGRNRRSGAASEISGEILREPTALPVRGGQAAERVRLGSPFHYRTQDSSIVSSLDWVNPLQESSTARPDGREPESLSLVDLELNSNSGSDSEEEAVPCVLSGREDSNVNGGTVEGFTEEQDRLVCAVSESRSADVIGVAVVNVTLGKVDLARIVNDDRYRRLVETLSRLPTRPQTFLVLKRVVDQRSKSSLALCLKKDFPDSEVVPLDRAHWHEAEGLKMVDRFAWRRDIKAIRKNLEHNFYVSCSLSAVMAYIEEEFEVIIRDNSLHFQYQQPADTMGLDRSTLTSLELFQNIRNVKGASSTLFALLNNCLTPQGRRMIRSTLLQPSTKRDEILARHEAVEELSSNEDLFAELRASLKRLLYIDVERSIPWVSVHQRDARLPLQDGLTLVEGYHQVAMPSHEELRDAEKDLNQLLMVKAYLGGLQAIRETLEAAHCTSQLCKWVLDTCGHDKTVAIVGLLDNGIEQDAIYSKAPIDVRNNRLWAVKAEPNGVLERARQLYRDLTNDMHQYVEGLNKVFQEQLGASPELRLANDNLYVLRFQWSDVERELTRHGPVIKGKTLFVGLQHWGPCVLGGIEVVNGNRRKQFYDCYTMELIQRSSEIQRQADVITSQSDKSVVELKKSLLSHAESLLAMNEATAVLDMICSFAYLATTQNYVRPVMSNNLILKGARHPLVEVRKQDFVPNDVYSGDQDARFQVVTGGNMSGKSTFIRSIALIQIMAQIGSFVPATYAAVPICDRLFTRLSTEDKPEVNLGTFAVEMTEMNMILRQATKTSLVIIDELGRGTSTKEGLAIALAMSEKLIDMRCRTFFATHFTGLASVLNSTRPSSVLNVHVAGESTKTGETTEIILPHTIAPGPVKNEDYGLELARRFFPERVMKNAEQICKFLREKKASKGAGPATRAVKQNKLILALPDLLKQAHSSTMDDSALASYLKKLQTEFTIRMNLAADDEAHAGEETENLHNTLESPVLEKPSREELHQWKQKCDAAERRVMQANMTHSREKKRPVLEDEENGCLPKRNKRVEGRKGTRPGLNPINRGSMIEELRKDACTPISRTGTPDSFSIDVPESLVDFHRGPVRGQDGTPEEEAGPVHRGSAMSSSPVEHDTARQDLKSRGDVPPASEYELASGDAFSEERQPLEKFQPLKSWYERDQAAVFPSAGDVESTVMSSGISGRSNSTDATPSGWPR